MTALATGLADKGVALFYETRLHDQPSAFYVARCHGQIRGTLAALEADRSSRGTMFWFGDGLGHADIAVACAIRHVSEAHPGLMDMLRYPALAGHCMAMEALPVFVAISQPFISPA